MVILSLKLNTKRAYDVLTAMTLGYYVRFCFMLIYKQQQQQQQQQQHQWFNQTGLL